MMHTYRAFGLTIASELRCPELAAGTGVPDVHITLAPPGAAGALPSGFEARPGHFVLRVPKMGRFEVTDGRRIDILRHPDADDDDLRLMLFGTAIGAILHQRAVLPLHGAALHRDGASVLILGASGNGKSTLSAAMAELGWQFQSDDISAVHVRDHRVWCQPGFPRRKMWPDVLQLLGHDPAALPRVRQNLEKRSQPVDGPAFFDAPAPVAHVVVLGAHREAEPALRRVEGPRRMVLLKHQVYRANLPRPLDMHRAHFEIINRLASQAVIWFMQRPRAGGSPAALAAFLAPHLTGAQAAV
jgi:predicted ATPase